MDKIIEAVRDYWGERCPDYDPTCFVCQAWNEVDTMSKETLLKNLSTKIASGTNSNRAIDPITVIMIINIITRIILYLLEKYGKAENAVYALKLDRVNWWERILLRAYVMKQMGVVRGNKVYKRLLTEIDRLTDDDKLLLIREALEPWTNLNHS